MRGIVDITSAARQHPDFARHERVLMVTEPSSGLDAIVAIHDTTLGPALGGCRIAAYESPGEALADVLRLSRAVTCKAAVAGLALGGGKAVVRGRPGFRPAEALFRAFGRALESLGGRYITGEDVGSTAREMDWIEAETRHVIGTTRLGGTPSSTTAAGVLAGMRAAVAHRLGTDRLAGATVTVQGLGGVGMVLCELLAAEGARLIVADIDPARCEEARRRLKARIVDPAEIHRIPADVFSPCALGGVLNDGTVAALRCAVVAGAANNQLRHPEIAETLRRSDILYAPDYVINAGGLIAAFLSLKGYRPGDAAVLARVREIGSTLTGIVRRAEAKDQSPAAVADLLAEERIAARHAARGATVERRTGT
ncbi:MAG: hypothetical protein GEU92_14465 [Alphaproteobacteria bacterium]|nr:hypothetical protein [Alphaproteobacteria bacterium]